MNGEGLSSKINDRKLEHIQYIINDPLVDRAGGYFDKYTLIHRALPEINLDEVDLSCSFLNHSLAMPLIISSMTGGDSESLIQINQCLAEAAQISKIALAVGSQRVALEREPAKASFRLRKFAPDVPLLANMGAVQLNYDYGIDECLQCIDMLEANALILHLNPLQEAIQPEGNTKFSGLLKKIEFLIKKLPVPLIIKEVGCGFSLVDLKNLISIGVEWVDTAGKGGTSWSRIEGHRSLDQDKIQDQSNAGFSLQDWGLSTPYILKLTQHHQLNLKMIASGGIRSAQDIAKALALGAQICGIAKPFLEPAMQDVDHVVNLIENLKKELKIIFFLLGQSHVQSLIGNKDLIVSRDQL
jgi:isopentenyl-diphosphate delta-isomerase